MSPSDLTAEYDSLALALGEAKLPVSAAEAHGVLTGLICAPREDAASAWRALLRAERGSGEGLAASLDGLLERTRGQLTGSGFEFDLLLPSEERALSERVDALADWSRGYLLGLAVGGLEDARPLPGPAGEFLQDLRQIAGAETDDEGTAEDEQEAELAEIVEYVRVGVQLVYEELHP